MVHRTRIQHRLRLPWCPADLRHHRLLFRRRDCDRENYVEDLRVCRNLVRRLLLLLVSDNESLEHFYHSLSEHSLSEEREASVTASGLPLRWFVDFLLSNCTFTFPEELSVRHSRSQCSACLPLCLEGLLCHHRDSIHHSG